jgi:hypothetical protein
MKRAIEQIGATDVLKHINTTYYLCRLYAGLKLLVERANDIVSVQTPVPCNGLLFFQCSEQVRHRNSGSYIYE